MTNSNHFPQSDIGQRFCKFFNHRYNYILAEKEVSGKPDWKTAADHPIEHRNLWNRFCEPHSFVGLSFDKVTTYGVLDVDRGSPYHPANSELLFKTLLRAYEDVGFNASIPLQSSFSEGLHIYLSLPKEVETYNFAVMLNLTAMRSGFQVKDGFLETFPNAKPYTKRVSAYKAHRLPLQKGSYLLDADHQPYSNQISTFLDLIEQTAQEQDMELIEKAIICAKATKAFRGVKGNGNKAAAFARDLREQIAEGWTDFGQTNDLLRIIGTYGRVFERLGGQDLAKYISNTAKGLPGYRKYCRHQYHIERRGREWGRCVQKFYYPYGSKPSRVGTFASMCEDAKKAAKENKVNDNRQIEAIERIKKGVEYLKTKLAELPKKVGAMKEALLNALNELFGKRPSNKTLSKYQDLWHPKYVGTPNVETEEESNAEEPQAEASNNTQEVNVTEEPQTEVSNHTQDNMAEELQTEPSNNTQEVEIAEESKGTPVEENINETVGNQGDRQEEKLQAEIQAQPSVEEADRPSPTPQPVVSENEASEKQPEVRAGKQSKNCPPPPLYMKVKQWENQKLTLTFIGSYGNGLVETKQEKKETLKSIYQNEQVKITNCNHSSFLFEPEDENNLLVYVTPISELKNWKIGIAVKAIDLKPT